MVPQRSNRTSHRPWRRIKLRVSEMRLRRPMDAAANSGITSVEKRARSRIEHGVPVEIVEPAVVQIIWREQPPITMQMRDAWLEWHLRRPHARLVRRHAALFQIAHRAGRDHVDPGGMAAARTRQKMIERQIVTRTTKL